MSASSFPRNSPFFQARVTRLPCSRGSLLALGLAGALLGGSCTSTSTPQASAPAGQSDDALARKSAWLLPSNVRAQSYQLEITLDPSKPTFQGTSTIDVVIAKPTSSVILHGRDLTIVKAWAIVHGQRIEAKSSSLPGADPRATPDELLLTFTDRLSGNAKVHLQFEGKFREDLGGLYRVESGGQHYAFSQFEPMDARSAFPCFDEPDQKVPFEIALRVPRGQQGFTNMNEVSRAEDDEWTRIQFATSPPMPSYLVAFAAGPLEVLEWQGPANAAPSIPTRLITTAGKSERGKLSLQWTTEHLALLEKYFSSPYPYPKLDIVAVPQFAAGAMENAGLVTFREELLLVTKDSSTRSVRRMASVVAHELAHMWFGDLVTMRWWDDLWLNEGFATWMSTKIIDQWRPSLEMREGSLGRIDRAMGQDSRPSARTMQQPVMTQTDAFRSFSSITYAKGSSILSMVEQWVGPTSFQAGIRTYLEENAWKNATSNDLFSALGGTTYPVPEVISSFTTQTGVPYVSVDWSCEDTTLEVTLQQKPYAPLGLEPSAENSTTPRVWMVPICTRFPDGEQLRKECTLLEQPQATWKIPVKHCPAWLAPNAEQSGYYRSQLTASHLEALGQSSQLSAREKVGWLLDAGAMLDAGDLLAADYLRASVAFVNAETRPSSAWAHFLGNVQWFEDFVLTDNQKPTFDVWLQAALSPELQRLGLSNLPNESTADRLLRSTVLRAAGASAHDPKVLRWAETITDQWLTDPKSVSGEDAAVALPLAGTTGNDARFARLVQTALTTSVAEHKNLAWGAVGRTSVGKQVEQLLQLVEDEKLTPSDFPSLVAALLSRKSTRSIAYPWLIKNFDTLVKRIPPFSLRRFMRSAIGRCSLEDRQAIEEFFLPRLSKLEGMDGVLKESRELAGHCSSLMQRNKESFSAYLGQ